MRGPGRAAPAPAERASPKKRDAVPEERDAPEERAGTAQPERSERNRPRKNRPPSAPAERASRPGQSRPNGRPDAPGPSNLPAGTGVGPFSPTTGTRLPQSDPAHHHKPHQKPPGTLPPVPGIPRCLFPGPAAGTTPQTSPAEKPGPSREKSRTLRTKRQAAPPTGQTVRTGKDDRTGIPFVPRDNSSCPGQSLQDAVFPASTKPRVKGKRFFKSS